MRCKIILSIVALVASLVFWATGFIWPWIHAVGSLLTYAAIGALPLLIVYGAQERTKEEQADALRRLTAEDAIKSIPVRGRN